MPIDDIDNCTQAPSLNQKPPMLVNEKPRQPKIWIVGGQKCVNLAADLTLSRRNTKYIQYDYYAFCKPGASTTEIIKSLHSMDIRDKDKIIISIPENDSNPLVTGNELYCILKKYEFCDIIVLYDFASSENYVRSTCKLFKNCHMLNSDLEILSDKISFNIDCLDYECLYITKGAKPWKKYVPSKKSLESGLLKTGLSKESSIRKGTIPYYFKKAPKFRTGNKVPFYYYMGVARKPVSTTNPECKSVNNGDHRDIELFRE